MRALPGLACPGARGAAHARRPGFRRGPSEPGCHRRHHRRRRRRGPVRRARHHRGDRRGAARRGWPGGEDAVVDLLGRLVAEGEAELASGRTERLPELNTRFHLAIAEHSGSASLPSLLRHVSDRIEWIYAMGVSVAGPRSWAEHRAILAAIAAGDPASAGPWPGHTSNAPSAITAGWAERAVGPSTSPAPDSADRPRRRGPACGPAAGRRAGRRCSSGPPAGSRSPTRARPWSRPPAPRWPRPPPPATPSRR